ncbi:MAG: hypothetical protein ACQEVA_01110 [Myxococcota bacterium]
MKLQLMSDVELAVELRPPADFELLPLTDQLGEDPGDIAPLCELFESIATLPTHASLDDLHAGEFERLLIELFVSLEGPQLTTSTNCEHCGERFDIGFDPRQLPRREGRPHDTPFEFQADGKKVRARLPRLRHRRDTAGAWSDIETRRQASLLAVDEQNLDSSECSPEVCASLDEELAIRSPGVLQEIAAACAECGQTNQFWFEPSVFVVEAIDRRVMRLLREVHALAWTYHWSERDILEMSRARRRKYLELIRDEVERE